MATHISITEIPSPQEDPILARAVAVLTLRELYGQSPPEQREADALMSEMWERVTVAALDANMQVLASGALLDLDSQTRGAMIVDVATSEASRGNGLGREIINALEEKARGVGVSKLSLVSLPGATGFYEGLGYQGDGNLYTKSLHD